MTRSIAACAAFIVTAGCIASRGGRTENPTAGAALASTDSIAPLSDIERGRRLAAARAILPRLPSAVERTTRFRWKRGTLPEGSRGYVVLGYLLLPDGRVDPRTRTVMFLDGNGHFARIACDFLLATKFRGGLSGQSTLVLQPFGFMVQQGIPRGIMNADLVATSEGLYSRLRGMSELDAAQSLAGAPACVSVPPPPTDMSRGDR